MSDEVDKLLPRVTALTEPYWSGCREGELRLQHCAACFQYQFYPRLFCSHCEHRELNWEAVSGRGRIGSYSIVQRPISAAYPAPTIVALVDLDEGPRMMSSLRDASAEDVRVGARVEVCFTAWSGDIVMPEFRIVTKDTAR